jgi:pimeloyl-[acyl-carrier protein] methyl ester esterase
MKESSLKTSTQGNMQGEPLFVFHGWAMNSSVWSVIKAELERDYLVTTVDLPGHGNNKNVLAHSLSQLVDLVLPLIETNTETKSHLMGWSLGGLLIQALADRAPHLFSSLTLVATTPRFSQTENWLNAMSHEVLDSFANNLQTDLHKTIKGFIGLQFMGINNSKQLQRELVESILTNTPNKASLCVGLDILRTADFRKSAQIIPQHWILGERDRLIPQSLINDLKLIRPDAQISLLKNTGHAPFMTHPNEFMLSFSDFMSQLTCEQAGV